MGVRQKFIFYTQKITKFQNLSTQKNHCFFLAKPKKPLSPFFATQKIPSVFSGPIKIPASFIDPKKSLLAKILDPKKSLEPLPPHPSPGH